MKFRASTCNSNKVMSDKRNSKWRRPPSQIYSFCWFWSHKSTSGSSWRHYCKISLIYVNWWLNYCCLCKNPRWRPLPSWILFFVQYFGSHVCCTSNVIHMPNFVQICAVVNELWAIDEIQNGGHLELFPFRFRVDRVSTFRDIAIWKFGFKSLSRPPSHVFWEFWPLNIILYHRDPPKGPTLCGSTRFEP